MHIQVINFNIKVSGGEYEEGAMELAPVFADLVILITFAKSFPDCCNEATTFLAMIYLI